MELVLGLIAIAVVGYWAWSANRPSFKAENDKINEQETPTPVAEPAPVVAAAAPAKKPAAKKPAAQAPAVKKPAAMSVAKKAPAATATSAKKPAVKGKPAGKKK